MGKFETLKALKEANDIKRIEILENARAFSFEFDKIQYICSNFLNSYEFDYSSLISAYNLDFQREYKIKSFEYNGETYHSSSVMSFKDAVASRLEDLQDNEKTPTNPVQVYPSVHALNMGTCIAFASELDWFAKEFGIDSLVICVYERCFDGYQGVKDSEELPLMQHFYNVMKLDGEEYKIDVAGALMAMDYRKKHSDALVSPKDFMFVEKDSKNPFDALLKGKSELGENE